MTKKQYGIAIERWDWKKKRDVRRWLAENFGEYGIGGKNCDKRWGTEQDYGLDNLYMDEDVYTWYQLRWGTQ